MKAAGARRERLVAVTRRELCVSDDEGATWRARLGGDQRLDEPTLGLDPDVSIRLRAQIAALRRERGTTIILTTHYMREAEELCDRIAIINHGKLIANKPTRELVDMAREKIVVVTLDADVTVLPTHPAFEKVERDGTRGLAISYNKDRMNAGEVLAAVNAMGHGIVDVSTREADLEDVFLNLTRSAA